MNRRDFVALLGGAAVAWPLAARAQQSSAKLPRVGIIDDAPIWDAFRQGLRDLGRIEGQNITIEYRTAEGKPERLAVAAAELVDLPVNVIATFGTPASRAAKAATRTIPIVAISIGDPVRAGLVASLARPGGNVTGNTIFGPDLVAKRLQLFQEVIPIAASVALLWNPDNASNAVILDELKIAAPRLGMKLMSVQARTIPDFERAFAAILENRPDAVLLTNDPLLQLHIGKIIDFLAQNRIPGVFMTRENVVAGGLMSYGTSFPDLFRRGAVYVDKILKGTKPADLPIEQPTKFELVVNLKTAKALGLTIPESFLLRADEVIE